MADGVEVPENMRRCMCNNFSLMGFWRGWHSSFNRWLVRYLCPATEASSVFGRSRDPFLRASRFAGLPCLHDLA